MKHTILLIFIGISCLSCKKNFEEIEHTDYPDPPRTLVDASIVGIVQNENGTPIPDFEVDFNGSKTSWEGSQYFKLDGKLINRDGEQLSIRTADGKTSSFAVKVIKNDVNYTYFTIIQAPVKTIHSLDQDIILESAYDSRLLLDKNQFRQGNKDYTGEVKSEVFFLNQQNPTHRFALPGSNHAVNLQKELVSLDILDAFYLDIRSRDHAELGTRMTIHSEELAGNLEDNVVWWFDDKAQLWVQLETTREANDGLSASFVRSGFFCISATNRNYSLTGKVVLVSRPVPGCKVIFESASGQQISTTTSNSGSWSIQIPKGASGSLIVQNECTEFKRIHIDPMTADQEIENIDCSADAHLFTILKGTVKDCIGKAQIGSFLYFEGEGILNQIFNEQSEIEVVVPICHNTELSISFSDISGKERCDDIVWRVAAITDVNSMFACQQARNQYFNIIVDDKNKMYWNTSSSVSGSRLKLDIQDPGNSGFEFDILIPAFNKVELQDAGINILFNDALFEGGGYSLYCPTSTLGCGFDKLVITHYPGSGDEWIRGYFEGTFWVKRISPPEANNRKMKGEFQVRKSF